MEAFHWQLFVSFGSHHWTLQLFKSSISFFPISVNSILIVKCVHYFYYLTECLEVATGSPLCILMMIFLPLLPMVHNAWCVKRNQITRPPKYGWRSQIIDCQSFLSYWWPVFKTLLMKSYHEINTLHLFEIYHRLILLNLQWWLIFLCFFYLLSGYFQRRKCQLPCVTAFGK